MHEVAEAPAEALAVAAWEKLVGEDDQLFPHQFAPKAVRCQNFSQSVTPETHMSYFVVLSFVF